MFNTITIDTETMDVKPSAVILSIGGFAFDIQDVNGIQASILEIACNPELANYFPTTFYGLVDTFGRMRRAVCGENLCYRC